jgi:hypothetical protein
VEDDPGEVLVEEPRQVSLEGMAWIIDPAQGHCRDYRDCKHEFTSSSVESPAARKIALTNDQDIVRCRYRWCLLAGGGKDWAVTKPHVPYFPHFGGTVFRIS